jgi:hypothetical protein
LTLKRKQRNARNRHAPIFD